MTPEIDEVAGAAERAQQIAIDHVLDVLETGTAISHAGRIKYRDDAQAERLRVLRDRLHPESEWAQRRAVVLPNVPATVVDLGA